MYKYKAYLTNTRIKDADGKKFEQLVGEWTEDLPPDKFMNSSDLMYCLKFATKPIIKNVIKKAYHIRTWKIKDIETEKIRVDFGSHYEFIDIYYEDVGNIS